LLQSAHLVAAVAELGSLDSQNIRQNDSRHHVGSRNRTVLDIASTRALLITRSWLSEKPSLFSLLVKVWLLLVAYKWFILFVLDKVPTSIKDCS